MRPDHDDLSFRGELEAMVQAQRSELLRRLIQGHLDQRSREEPMHERVVGAEGVARTHHREGCRRCLETRFGEVVVTRRGYGGRAVVSVFPLDAELNLAPDKYSHGLREVLVEEVVGGSFDEAVDHLARAGGGQIAKVSGDLAAYLAFHFAHEQQRNYPGLPIPLAASHAT